jgi:hypothetical protein
MDLKARQRSKDRPTAVLNRKAGKDSPANGNQSSPSSSAQRDAVQVSVPEPLPLATAGARGPPACFTRGFEEAAGVACGTESVWVIIQAGLALATRPGEEPRRPQCLSVTKTPGIPRPATAVDHEAPRLGRRVQPEAQQRGSGPAQGFSYETRPFLLDSWPASGSALGKPSVAASSPSGAAAAGTGP